MALAGSPDAIQFEVVAPLRADAPCVGVLNRKGEGPYHCCWRVPSVDRAIDIMRERCIKHTVIKRNGMSQLFPGDSIAFVVVDGIGLVEFLGGHPTRQKGNGLAAEESSVVVEIHSDNIKNAREFVRLIADNPGDGEQRSCQCAPIGSTNCVVRLTPSTASGSAVFLTTEAHSGTFSRSMNGENLASRGSGHTCSTNWWSRVRLGRCSASVERIQQRASSQEAIHLSDDPHDNIS